MNRPPDYAFAKGIPLLDRDCFARAQSLIPALLQVHEIQPLSAHEAVRVMQLGSPRSAWTWAQAREHANQAAFVAASDGGLGVEIGRLEALLEGWIGCPDPVSVTTAFPKEQLVTFFVDADGFSGWSPLVVRDGVPGLHVKPGHVITK